MKPVKIVCITAIATVAVTIGVEALLYSKGLFPGQSQIVAASSAKSGQPAKEAENPTLYTWIIQAAGHPEGPGGVSKPNVILVNAENDYRPQPASGETGASEASHTSAPSDRWKKVKVVIRKGSTLFDEVDSGRQQLIIGNRFRLEYGPEQKGVEIESAEGLTEHNLVINWESP
jgi:hypothetical protein